MAYQLDMDKTLSIKHLHASGLSERRIAQALEVSRNAVRRHLAGIESNDTNAPAGSDEPAKRIAVGPSRSCCEPFRDVVLSKLEQGLDAQRIYQDLVEENGFEGKYWLVRRFVKRLQGSRLGTHHLLESRRQLYRTLHLKLKGWCGARSKSLAKRVMQSHSKLRKSPRANAARLASWLR